MTDKIVRLNSFESGPFSSTFDVVHLKVPGMGDINMEKSYIEVAMKVNTTNAANAPADYVNAVYNVQLSYGGSEVAFGNGALIQDIRLSSQNQGLLEEIIDCDRVSQALMQYNKSHSMKDSGGYTTVYQLYDSFRNKYSPFRTYNTVNDLYAADDEARIPIPLSTYFGLGKLRSLNLEKTGELDIRCQLGISNITADVIGSGYEPTVNITAGLTNSLVLATPETSTHRSSLAIGMDMRIMAQNTVGTVVEPVYYACGTAAAPLSIDNVATAGGNTTVTFSANATPPAANRQGASIQQCYICNNIDTGSSGTELTLTATYQNLESLPFWKGAPVLVTATRTNEDNGDNTGYYAFTIITDIQWNNNLDANGNVQNPGIVQLTLATAFDDVDPNGDLANDAKCIRIGIANQSELNGAFATAVVAWNELNLVAHMNGQPQKMEQYQYDTLLLEKDSGANVTNYYKTFIMPPNCINAFGLFSSDASPYSILSVADNYRLKLDSVNLSQENVVFQSPLYYDEVNRTLLNSSLVGRDWEKVPNANERDLILCQQNGLDQKVVFTHLPMTPEDKLLEVNINCTGAGVNNFSIYKQVRRVLE